MTIQKTKKALTRLLGLCLIIFVPVSCTYDYFVDENNLRIYVPQIKDNEISNFHIEFHDKITGKHFITRFLEAPFDKDELMKEGILRFKLPPGNYSATCFANYNSNSLITPDSPFGSSYKYQEKADVVDGDNVYLVSMSKPRAVLTEVTAYPFGHPDGKIPVEINIDDSKRFKGQVISIFEELPDVITRIDIFYKGLASKYDFNGVFTCFDQYDRLYSTIQSADYKQDNKVVCVDDIYPSEGVGFQASPSYINAGVPLEYEARFYEGKQLTGNVTFTSADLANLAADRKPVDKNGNPVTDLILYPQETITFTFKGFTLIKVELQGWGEIVPGESTPM